MSSSSRPIAPEDGSSIHSRREEQHHRSLRECTTCVVYAALAAHELTLHSRRLTRYFSSEVGKGQVAPVLTSRVQWDNLRIDNEYVTFFHICCH